LTGTREHGIGPDARRNRTDDRRIGPDTGQNRPDPEENGTDMGWIRPDGRDISPDMARIRPDKRNIGSDMRVVGSDMGMSECVLSCIPKLYTTGRFWGLTKENDYPISPITLINRDYTDWDQRNQG
jgi:hypothetical protein